MINYQKARDTMVQVQLINRGVTDENVIKAMRKVERHLFIADEYKLKAYDDSPILINCNQTISQPYMVALMTELLQLKSDHKVLEIGTGSGYQTAILAELCNKVYSIERHLKLVNQAEALLKELDYTNVEIKYGDGSYGYLKNAPYNAIIVTAGAPELNEELIDLLVDRGQLVIPVGNHRHQDLMSVSKRGDSYISKVICKCVFVPLIGDKGWAK